MKTISTFQSSLIKRLTKAALCLVLLVGGMSLQAQTQPEEIVGKFFETFKSSPDQAMDELLNSNTWLAQNTEGLNKLKNQLNNFIGLVGTYEGYEKISERSTGGSVREIAYLVKYERQPIRFVFLFYKPSLEWRINNFSFDEKVFEEN